MIPPIQRTERKNLRSFDRSSEDQFDQWVNTVGANQNVVREKRNDSSLDDVLSRKPRMALDTMLVLAKEERAELYKNRLENMRNRTRRKMIERRVSRVQNMMDDGQASLFDFADDR